MLRRGGRLVEVGHYFDSGAIQLKPHTVCQKEVDILGVWAYPPIQFETALSLLQRTAAPIDELLSTPLPLAELEEGLRLTGREETVKVVINPGA